MTWKNTILLILSLLFLINLSCIDLFLGKNSVRELSLSKKEKVTVLHNRAGRLIEDEQYEEAELTLDSLNTLNPKAWNYLQLGKIARIQEKWYKAEKYLKKAKDMKFHYAEACYELGCVYDDGPFLMVDAYMQFHWAVKYDPDLLDAYYRKARIRMIDRGYGHGLTELEPLILKNPDYKDCYILYSRIGLAFHKHNRLSRFYRKLTNQYPDSTRFKNDLIKAVYLNRNYSAAFDTLESCKEAFLTLSPAIYYLHRGRILLGLEEDKQAWIDYSRGMSKIKTFSEADEYFKDIRYIVTEEEYEQYLDAGIAVKKDLLRVFWKSRDPTLTSVFNERFPEHFKRLRYALKHNRSYPELELIEFLMEDFKVPEPYGLMRKFGQSSGSKFQRVIDDLGIIYLRHGKPDKFYTNVQFMGGFNLSWHYPPRGERPEMTFHFYRPKKSMEDFVGMREVQRGWVLRLNALNAEPGCWATEAGPREVYQSIMVGTSTTTTDYIPRRPLEYLSEHYEFRSDSAEKINLYFEIPDDLIKRNSDRGIHLKYETVLFNGGWEEITRLHGADYIQEEKSKSPYHCVRKVEIPVHPGRYFVGFKLFNSNDGSEGDSKFMINVQDSRRGGLGLSRIMLANLEANKHIFKAEYESKSRSDAIIPSLRRQFKKNEPIVVYFEFYNLLPDQNHRTNATVSVTVSRKKLFKSGIARLFSTRDEPVSITLEHTLRGSAENEYYLQSITLPEYRPGEYELEIRVKDNNVNTSLVRSTRFTVVK